MPRRERQKEAYSTYHIIMRGNEKRNIFLAEEDRDRFMTLLERAKESYNFKLYAYCLMANHVHLVLMDNGHDISQTMKSINTGYAVYFNKKYERSGHLFQDRFRSQIITEEPYLLEVSRYVHNNPVKANLVKYPSEYLWSSYNEYMMQTYDSVVDIEFILSFFDNDINVAVNEYQNFVLRQDQSDKSFMDIDDGQVKSSECPSPAIISGQSLLIRLAQNQQLEVEEYLKTAANRYNAVKELKQLKVLTLKEIGQLCGNISESRVSHILREKL